jgi:hypothetical protein
LFQQQGLRQKWRPEPQLQALQLQGQALQLQGQALQLREQALQLRVRVQRVQRSREQPAPQGLQLQGPGYKQSISWLQGQSQK